MLKPVYFICPTLGGGGAERILVHLLKHLDRKRFQPWLILLKKEGEFLAQVPGDVPIIGLNKKHWFDFLKLLFLLAFRIFPRYKPELVFSFIDYTSILTLLAALVSPHKPKVIIRVGINLEWNRDYQHFSFLQEALLKKLYPLAKQVIAVSEGVASDLINNFRISKNLVKVIYNGIHPEELRAKAAELTPLGIPVTDLPPENVLRFVACGRLSQAKNFPLLLRAYAQYKKDLQLNSKTRELQTSLSIIGEGRERPVLEALIKDLALEQEVKLLGFQQNPYKFLSRADIFVASSNNEGFPNTLLEAMACRVAAIATDCPSGPAEIIEHGVNGLLVPVNDIQLLAAAMLMLTHDPALRSRLALAGRERAEVFSLGNMLYAYETVIAYQLKH